MNALTRNPMHKRIFLFLVAACFTHTSAIAALDISQVPLFLAPGGGPNVMFILDDSGSMQFEVLPDEEITSSNRFLFPTNKDFYGSGGSTPGYSNYVPDFDDSNPKNFRRRSSQWNKAFYNPKIRYRPWLRADGSQYPDADPKCAPHNPAENVGCRNLTVENNGKANSNTDAYASRWYHRSGYSRNTRLAFWPATYYTWTGNCDATEANKNNSSCYSKIEIRNNSQTYDGGPNRTDCSNPNACTYSEEIQNFANWYTYYRSRVLLARAGIGRAFSGIQSDRMRVGFGAINQGSRDVDDVSSPGTIIMGVRPFNAANRATFYEHLYEHTIPAKGTPLRRALDDAGQYFMRTDNRGPWGNQPGIPDSTEHLACRQSYSILMTDGYWTDDNASAARASARRANVDGQTGSTIYGPGGKSYRYQPALPYSDSYADTLADVAMYYWKNDLRPDLENKVPTQEGVNEAFWQHMVTFGVGLGVTGTLDPATDLPALTSGAKRWPDPASSENAKLDDLWHAAINSRGGFFSAADPETFANELQSTLLAISARTTSASAVTASATQIGTDTKLYRARFNTENWTGEFLAYRIDPDTGDPISTPLWDAGSKLPSHAQRNIITYRPDNKATVDFKWSDLNSSQREHLNTLFGNNDGLGQDRVEYLRGDRSKESDPNNPFRTRARLLGDIINSDPVYVANQNYGYGRLDGQLGERYEAFRQQNKNRTPVVYIGANDGMLHAFHAETGEELFAYVPNALYPKLSELSAPNYAHNYYVDGGLWAGDAYINGAWRTILLGSLGAGGRAIFALDITSPRSPRVLWEFTHQELGYSLGQPSFARLESGKWVALVGNGYNSNSHQARLFALNLENGDILANIATGAGNASNPNGLASPFLYKTDHVYAGDLLGNLWKFDLTHSNDKQWKLAKNQPLFTARDRDGNPQPITSGLDVGDHPDGGTMVFFGTGKYFESHDNIVGNNPRIHSFYGIRDNGNTISGRSQLQEQTIEVEAYAPANGLAYDVRTVSQVPTNYSSVHGWYLDLVSPSRGRQGEQVIYEPILLPPPYGARSPRIVFTTLIPNSDPCDFGGGGWLMELDAITGARTPYSVFDLNLDGRIDAGDFLGGVPASGRGGEGGIMRLHRDGIVSAGDIEYKYAGSTSGEIEVTRERAGAGAGRKSWRQVR